MNKMLSIEFFLIDNKDKKIRVYKKTPLKQNICEMLFFSDFN